MSSLRFSPKKTALPLSALISLRGRLSMTMAASLSRRFRLFTSRFSPVSGISRGITSSKAARRAASLQKCERSATISGLFIYIIHWVQIIWLPRGCREATGALWPVVRSFSELRPCFCVELKPV